MATRGSSWRSYSDIKAGMGSDDALILERLVERQDSPLAVVCDLQSGECMSQSEAFGRVRDVLRRSIRSLRTVPAR